MVATSTAGFGSSPERVSGSAGRAAAVGRRLLALRENLVVATTFTTAQLIKNLDRMRTIALALPDATEELTWGTAINFRVRKKIFLFPGSGASICVKAEREELPALLDDPRRQPAP